MGNWRAQTGYLPLKLKARFLVYIEVCVKPATFPYVNSGGNMLSGIKRGPSVEIMALRNTCPRWSPL